MARCGMPRIGCLIRSYGLTDYLPAVLKSYGWVEKIVIMNYRFKSVEERLDDTGIKCVPFKNVVIKTGELRPDLHEALNLGLEEFKNFDFVFTSDADELIAREDQNRLIAGMTNENAGCCTIIDYADDLNHKIPHRSHMPVVIVKPHVRFNDARCVPVYVKRFEDVMCHHFGYVFKPEEMAWKLKWEMPWEKTTVIRLLDQKREECEIPEEIKEWLK